MEDTCFRCLLPWQGMARLHVDTENQEVLLVLDVSMELTITDYVAPADIRMLSIGWRKSEVAEKHWFATPLDPFRDDWFGMTSRMWLSMYPLQLRPGPCSKILSSCFMYISSKTAPHVSTSDRQWTISKAMRTDLRQLEVPDVVQKYRVGYLKASSWVGARPVLGAAQTVPWVGAPFSLRGGSPVFAA